MSNIITAIINLTNNPMIDLKSLSSSNNRANSTGYALEEYIKDLFANTLSCHNESDRLEKISEVFSYIGNNSNPPDAILKNGDAIEIKKIENYNSAIALNSSYPKCKLYANSNMISSACKEAEIWTEKDMIYTIGIVQKNRLKQLCMVYGTDYCATTDTYEKIKNKIKDGISEIPNIELVKTNELGKLNKVDPLGITYLRVRGMWGIENPFKTFNYVFKRDNSKEFTFMAIINLNKYNSFDNKLELEKLALINSNLNISDIKIKNPNNPAQLIDAKLITIII